MSHIKNKDYVRTENGRFDKVINDDYYMTPFIECEKGVVDVCSIVKHSNQIVDLLECEDILKIDVGFTYILFYISTITTDKIIDRKSEIRKSDIGNFIITDGCFKGCTFKIVTKEKFKSMEYGEEL